MLETPEIGPDTKLWMVCSCGGRPHLVRLRPAGEPTVLAFLSREEFDLCCPDGLHPDYTLESLSMREVWLMRSTLSVTMMTYAGNDDAYMCTMHRKEG